MTQEQLDAIKARHAAATRGVWIIEHPFGMVVSVDGNDAQYKADMDFLRCVHRDISGLIKEIERLKKEEIRLTSENECLKADLSDVKKAATSLIVCPRCGWRVNEPYCTYYRLCGVMPECSGNKEDYLICRPWTRYGKKPALSKTANNKG